MDRPNYKDVKDMVLCGVMASEVVDSSGEICRIAGMNIDSLEAGQGVCNYEHLSASDGGGSEVVGKITYCKKIYKESDCDTPEQKYFFREVRSKPFLYGEIRLADGAGHSKAIDLAAHIRDSLHHDKSILLGLSIEGSTLKKENNEILGSIARRVALTFTPCNKTATTKLISDPNAPDGFNKVDLAKAEIMQDPQYRKIGGSVSLVYNPIMGSLGNLQESDNSPNIDVLEQRLVKNITAIKALRKTMTAGCGECAPSALTGGAALQKEDLGPAYKGTVLASIRDFDSYPFNRKKFKEHLKKCLEKAQLAPISESFIDHFTSIAEDSKLKKSTNPLILKDLGEVAEFFGKANRLEECLIELRKATRQTIEGGHSVEMPEVYKVNVSENGKTHQAGRFMISKGKLHHLEDYDGLLENVVPEGDVTSQTAAKINELANSPRIDLQKSPVETEQSSIDVNPQVSAEKLPEPKKPAVFSYFRPGMAKPHVVEFSPHGAALDGKALSEDELTLMLENARKGLARVNWGAIDGLQKSESTEGLIDQDEGLQHIKEAVRTGDLHPLTEKALAQHVLEDPIVAGVGNKYATQQFKKQNKPGAYASIHLNDFDHLKKVHGQETGEEAVKSFGGALKNASDKVGSPKLFRVSGDRLLAWAPTYEDMSRFLGEARNSSETLPLVGGTHRQTFSVGIGHSAEAADNALGIAKQGKLDPVSKQSLYAPGKSPNLGYSLYTGAEGRIMQPETNVPKMAIG
jgi:GGDEF domain-containing protein